MGVERSLIFVFLFNCVMAINNMGDGNVHNHGFDDSIMEEDYDFQGEDRMDEFRRNAGSDILLPVE